MSARRGVARAVLAGGLALAAVATGVGQAQAGGGQFRAHLSGAQEVPERETRAQGQAVFTVDRSGNALHYRLVVSNVENVVASHIHAAAEGANGPAVAFLYGAVAPGGGRTDGVLATGTITADDLVGPLAGRSVQDLVDAMRAGGTYVNVHTNDGVAPAGTGPGDFPGGEIRGQVFGG